MTTIILKQLGDMKNISLANLIHEHCGHSMKHAKSLVDIITEDTGISVTVQPKMAESFIKVAETMGVKCEIKNK